MPPWAAGVPRGIHVRVSSWLSPESFSRISSPYASFAVNIIDGVVCGRALVAESVHIFASGAGPSVGYGESRCDARKVKDNV